MSVVNCVGVDLDVPNVSAQDGLDYILERSFE